MEGDTIVLTCNATASPIPSIFWNTSTLKSNYSLMEISQVILEPSLSKVTSTALAKNTSLLTTMYLVSQVLRIDRAEIEDNDRIYCQAENDVGKATSSVEIVVHCKF